MAVRALAEPGVDVLDDRVRVRLAEILSSGGVPHAQITLEVLYFLPKDFLNAYERMFTTAVKADGGESRRAEAQMQGGEVGKARGKGAKTTGKRYKKSFVVMDEKALELKSRMDKRLRMMARDITNGLAGVEMKAAARQCGECGTFMQAQWKFCPMDGSSACTD